MQAGNEERLYGEHADLLDEEDFDFALSGARILGRDWAAMTAGKVRDRVEDILGRGLDELHGEALIRALPLQSQDASRLLHSLHQGLIEGQKR